MPGWLTDFQLQQVLLDQLQKSNASNSATLEPWWEGVVSRANLWAYWEIVGRLAERGFTKSQIDAWDRGQEFQQDLGLWRAISQLAAMQPDTYSAKGLESLDRRKELTGSEREDIKPVGVTSGGLWQDPAGVPGQVSTGGYDQSQDMFVWPDPDDSRLGEVSEF